MSNSDTRNCENCDKRFASKSAAQRFCNGTCRDNFHNRERQKLVEMARAQKENAA